MSGASIAAEVAQAYREVSREVGDGQDPIAYLIASTTQVNPWDPPATTSEYEATAYQPKLRADKIDGTLILATDVMLNLAEPQIVPTTAMRIRWQGKEYKIQNVWPLAPSGFAINYLVQARV